MVSSSRCEVHEAGPADVSVLATLAERTYRETFRERDTPEILERVVRETRSVQFFKDALATHTALLAENDGTPAGYALFGPVDQRGVVPQEGDRELVRLYVLRDYQHRGIGRALMDTALVHPTMAAAPYIYLDVWRENERAKAFYRRYGFVETGVVNGDHEVMVRAAPRLGWFLTA